MSYNYNRIPVHVGYSALTVTFLFPIFLPFFVTHFHQFFQFLVHIILANFQCSIVRATEFLPIRCIHVMHKKSLRTKLQRLRMSDKVNHGFDEPSGLQLGWVLIKSNAGVEYHCSDC